MRNVLTSLACLISVSVYGQGACNNQSSVTHQGYEYDIVEIGDQCWFAENCRYLPSVSPSSSYSEIDPIYYVYDYEGTDIEVAKSTANYETYGVLYNWSAVMTEGICPSGWHIPSDGEWQTMEVSLGMSESEASSTSFRGAPVGDYLKSTSGWNYDGNGTNSSGFNGLPAGYADTDGFYVNGKFAYWWSSSASGSSGTWQRFLYGDSVSVFRVNDVGRFGLSARCARD
jgi:uncharacterized protein (TIGR02145 family)